MGATFKQCLDYSQSDYVVKLAYDALKWRFPDLVSIEHSIPLFDKKGVDLWVKLKDGRYFGVDLKIQRFYNGTLPLEVWSNVEARRCGWTLRKDYITDYVLWIWPKLGISKMISFRSLRATFLTNRSKWCRTYKVRQQYTISNSMPSKISHVSEIVPVPIDIVERAVSMWKEKCEHCTFH